MSEWLRLLKWHQILPIERVLNIVGEIPWNNIQNIVQWDPENSEAWPEVFSIQEIQSRLDIQCWSSRLCDFLPQLPKNKNVRTWRLICVAMGVHPGSSSYPNSATSTINDI